MTTDRYPKLMVNLEKLRSNIRKIQNMCQDNGVEVAGVVKGFTGLPECTAEFENGGCKFVASSRVEQLRQIKNYVIQVPMMMIRIPMLSEAAEVVELADISLNSSVPVLTELNRQAGLQDKKHQVILMADLGDLREGFWDKEEMIEVAVWVENELHNLELAGVGTNLGCYGSIAPTPDKMDELVELAEQIEERIGRELEYISGGATTTLTTMMDGNLNKRINMLRIGEGIVTAVDLVEHWGYEMNYMHNDVFTLRAEVVEVKEKPTHPIGKIMVDCFGRTPEYEDRGIRKRAIVAMGRVDYGEPGDLKCMDKRIQVIGASSDHTILDIEDAPEIRVGDIVEFKICYANLVYLTSSDNINMAYIL